MSEHLPKTNTGYETTDVTTPPIWKFLGYLFIVTFASIGLMAAMFYGLETYNKAQDPQPTPMEAERVLPSGPRLQVNEPQDLKTFLAKEEAVLNSYGWEDKTVKVVRLPIARAMELVAEHGLPKFEVKDAKGAPKAQEKK